MGILQARLNLGVFILIAGYIAYNAVYLQEGRHPAPMADNSAAEPGTAIRKQATTPRDARALAHRGRTPLPINQSERVRAIQRHLGDKGYQPGPADGVLGAQTRAAIMAFETDHNLPLTGQATDGVLQSLILGAAAPSVAAASDQSVPQETTELIKMVQKTLAKLGYDPGPVDGLIGASTQEAIRNFEKKQNLPVKGRISGSLVKELKAASGGRLVQIASN